MKPTVLFALPAAALLLGVAGCISPSPQPAARAPLAEEVSFARREAYPAAPKVPDEGDPRQLVHFALNLSRMGRHAHAAEFLNETAGRFLSRNNDFALACRKAAAVEYLLANDPAAFRQTIDRLKAEMNRYQRAGADNDTSALLGLGEVASGVSRPSGVVPRELHGLYEQGQAQASHP